MFDLRKITATSALLMLTVAMTTGCSAEASKTDKTPTSDSATTTEAEATVTTVKNCGKETTFDKKPEKVVSMGVTGLAYLVAAGAENNVIGRANEWGEAPASWIGNRADSIKELSPDALSMEALVAAKPDLAYGGGFDSTHLSPDQVAEKGIPAIVDEPECHYFYSDQEPNESFDTILNEVTQLGKVMGTSDQADKTVSELKEKLEKIKEENPGAGRTVSYAYYFGDDNDLFSYGEQGVMGEINKTLGIKSAIDPSYHPHQGPIAPEAFVKSNPDMIIVLTGMGGATKESTMERLSKIPGYSDMKAVKDNQIFFIESASAYASPSAIYGTIELADQIRK